jgi:hypothetical protein
VNLLLDQAGGRTLRCTITRIALSGQITLACDEYDRLLDAEYPAVSYVIAQVRPLGRALVKQEHHDRLASAKELWEIHHGVFGAYEVDLGLVAGVFHGVANDFALKHRGRVAHYIRDPRRLR